jgi:hypothetical protein
MVSETVTQLGLVSLKLMNRGDYSREDSSNGVASSLNRNHPRTRTILPYKIDPTISTKTFNFSSISLHLHTFPHHLPTLSLPSSSISFLQQNDYLHKKKVLADIILLPNIFFLFHHIFPDYIFFAGEKFFRCFFFLRVAKQLWLFL